MENSAMDATAAVVPIILTMKKIDYVLFVHVLREILSHFTQKIGWRVFVYVCLAGWCSFLAVVLLCMKKNLFFSQVANYFFVG
jgi:hypothetical protein